MRDHNLTHLSDGICSLLKNGNNFENDSSNFLSLKHSHSLSLTHIYMLQFCVNVDAK